MTLRLLPQAFPHISHLFTLPPRLPLSLWLASAFLSTSLLLHLLGFCLRVLSQKGSFYCFVCVCVCVCVCAFVCLFVCVCVCVCVSHFALKKNKYPYARTTMKRLPLCFACSAGLICAHFATRVRNCSPFSLHPMGYKHWRCV